MPDMDTSADKMRRLATSMRRRNSMRRIGMWCGVMDDAADAILALLARATQAEAERDEANRLGDAADEEREKAWGERIEAEKCLERVAAERDAARAALSKQRVQVATLLFNIRQEGMPLPHRDGWLRALEVMETQMNAALGGAA